MSETAKLLTVIVPSYNMEAYLPKCLGSLIGVGEGEGRGRRSRSTADGWSGCEGMGEVWGTQTPSAYAEVRPDLCGYDPRNTADATTASGRVRAQTTNQWRRAAAERKVAEWLEGVDEATFEAALVRLVEEKSAAGEYRFKREEERELALEGARRFYREFSRKIVPLSDGRCVYFAPDSRARTRNASNAISWAEYAFHAVSNGGAKVSGKTYNERWYNPYKIPVFEQIESVLRQERCFIRLSSVDVRYDAIVFAGTSDLSRRVQVVTRLDEVGNIDANLSEVTFTASSKEKKLPRLVPLAEAVRTVVHYQTTAGSYPPNEISIAHPVEARKGGDEGDVRSRNYELGTKDETSAIPNSSFSLLNSLDVIVVNDGSTDRTSEIAHDFERRYPGVFRVIDKPNGNYGSCINAALPEARGRFVKILDADDTYDKEVFLRYLKALEAMPEETDMVVNDYVEVDEAGSIGKTISFELPTSAVFGVEMLVQNRCSMAMHALAYRTSLLREINYTQLEGISHTDTEWFYLPAAQSKTIGYIPLPVYRYLLGRAGQTMEKSSWLKNRWMMEKIFRRMLEQYDAGVYGDAARKYLEFQLRRMCSLILYLYGDGSLQSELPSFYRRLSPLVVGRPFLSSLFRDSVLFAHTPFRFHYLEFIIRHPAFAKPMFLFLKWYGVARGRVLGADDVVKGKA